MESSPQSAEVALPLVSFRHVFRFVDTGETIASTSTLRFRDRDELAETLTANGFEIHDIRSAPDRPGRELVVLATPTGRRRGVRNGPIARRMIAVLLELTTPSGPPHGARRGDCPGPLTEQGTTTYTHDRRLCNR